MGIKPASDESMTIDKNPIKWRFNVRRRFSWFVEYFQIMGTNKAVFNKVLGINFAYSNMKKDADYNEFIDETEHNCSLAMVREKTKQNFDFLWELAKRSCDKSQKLVSTAKKILTTNYKDFSNPELKILFEEIALQLMEYQPIMFLIFPVENYLEKSLENAIKEIAGKKGRQNKIKDYLSVFSMPKEELVAVREEKDLLEIAIAKKEGKQIESELKEHVKNFAWIPTDDPAGKPWNQKELMGRINSLLQYKPKERLEKIKQGEKEREKKYEEYAKELELDEKTIELIRLVREFVYLRNYRVECWVQAQFLVRPFLIFVAGKAKLGFDELMALSSEEINNFLEHGKIIQKKEIEKRLRAYAYIKIGEKYNAFFGEDAKKIAQPQEKEKQEQIGTEIRGSIANKGKAIGIVKIVKELSDISKVKKGDILVASMTLPQYIPAMEKAAAFVTDEGGITSHAAIISRELNVPCIVGTKNATKLLKDGDKIEVDANKGIARKIS
jgi:phosphohistidine swiveling domain-containing protein